MQFLNWEAMRRGKEVPEHQPKQYVPLYIALLGSYLKEM